MFKGLHIEGNPDVIYTIGIECINDFGEYKQRVCQGTSDKNEMKSIRNEAHEDNYSSASYLLDLRNQSLETT